MQCCSIGVRWLLMSPPAPLPQSSINTIRMQKLVQHESRLHARGRVEHLVQLFIDRTCSRGVPRLGVVVFSLVKLRVLLSFEIIVHT